MSLTNDLRTFRREVAGVGSILLAYTYIEYDLFLCIKAVRQEFDLPLRTMFGIRGEERRINAARDLGSPGYHDLGLENEFLLLIENLHYCRLIRNQYAHRLWWNDLSGQMALGNLEELVQQEGNIENLQNLDMQHVNAVHIQNQLQWFNYCDDLILWLINRGNELAGRQFHPQYGGDRSPPAPLRPALTLQP